MGILSRLSTLLRSNLNELIARAEDPEKILEQCILDMRDSLTQTRAHVARAIADEKRLKKQLENELLHARDWEKKAKVAIRAGKDDLARSALTRKASHEELAAEYQRQWELQKAATDKLKGALRGLQAKIEEATRRKNLLKARAQRIRTQRVIQETLGGLGNNAAADTFDRIAERIEHEEALVEANEELLGEDIDLAEQIDALEHTTQADDALIRLKQQMGITVKTAEPVPVTIAADESR